MEIVVNLEPWPEDSPVSHDSTIIYIKDENRNVVGTDTITGLVYVKEIDIPIGYTYYVVAERQFSLKDSTFDISNINYQSEEFVIANNESEISNMLLATDVVIDTPYIFVNRDEIKDSTKDTFTITSSKYSGVGDGHTFTHWIIKSNGEIKFRQLRDNNNKTSIEVNKNIVKNLNSFEIICIHCSNNIESDMGILKVTLNTLNFELENNTIGIVTTGSRIKVKRLDNTKSIGLTKILFKHKDEIVKIITTNPLLENDFEYIIPYGVLELKRDMVVELYGNDISGELGKKSYKIDVIDSLYDNDSSLTDYKYNMTFTDSTTLGNLPIMVADSFKSKIVIPGDGILDLYLVDEEGGFKFEQTIQSLSIGDIKKDNIYSRYTDDNYLIIDVEIANTNTPRFIIFKHNILNNTFSLVNVIDRTDEIVSLGYNNSIEFINSDEFIYTPYGSNELKKVNYKTGIITNLASIPEPTIDGATIIKMFDNNILVLSNVNHHTYIYNVEKNEYRNGISIPYEKLMKRTLKKVDLINGDRLLISIDDETSDGTIGWFNSTDSTLSLLDNKLINISSNYSLYRKNNEIFIGITKIRDFINYEFDTVLVTKVL